MLSKDYSDLGAHPVWQLLLQHNQNGFLIKDPTFYLTEPDIYTELKDTVTLFFSSKHLTEEQVINICRFPARYEWLREQLNFFEWPDALSLCPNFAEFLQRVPLDNLYLVYAAENITQPSSMMGHSFLAFKGVNIDGDELAHALTFFTDVDLTRPIDLLWGSLMKGKPGHLVISPLRQQLAFYLHDEQRNIYEYPVVMAAKQRALLQAHIWELRQVNIDYFFHTFNCATLTNNLMSFASEEMLQNSTNWLSPLDVVKLSSQQGILKSPTLYPSDKWKVREISKVLRSRKLQVEFNRFYAGESFPQITDPEVNMLFVEKSDGLASFQYHEGGLTESQFNQKRQKLSALLPHSSEHQLQLPAHRDPLLRANDSQVGVAWSHDERISIRWLPAAHLVSDNHRHAFSESELQLFSLKASYQRSTNSLRVDDATLYAVSSFLPYDTLTGGLSGRFHIRATRQQKAAQQLLTPTIGGGLGASLSIHQDIMLYSLLNIAVEQHQGLYLTTGAEAGLIMYQLFNNKSLISFQHDLNYLGSGKSRQRFQWQQSWFVHRQFTLNWGFEKQWFQRQQNLSTSLEFRKYY